MADPTTARNAPVAYGAWPTPEGDLNAPQQRVAVPDVPQPSFGVPRTKPWNPNADSFQGATRDAQVGAHQSGLAEPLWNSPKTADALIRAVHGTLVQMPGQERARFLDAYQKYQETIQQVLQSMRGGGPPDTRQPLTQEQPAAAPGDENAIASQMGLNPIQVRLALEDQQQSPTQQSAIEPPGAGLPGRTAQGGQGGQGGGVRAVANARGY